MPGNQEFALDSITILQPTTGQSLGASFTVSGTVQGNATTVYIVIKNATTTLASSGPVAVSNQAWSYTFNNITSTSPFTIYVYYTTEANAARVTGLTSSSSS